LQLARHLQLFLHLLVFFAQLARPLLHPLLQLRIEREQLCLRALPLDCDSGKVGGDFSESRLFGTRAAWLLTIHGEGAEHLAL
jgi:hypothetical protein